MAQQNAHTLYGGTNEASCVPDASPIGNAFPVGDYLADTLMLWECYENKPAEGAPLVLRFETCDLVIQPSRSNKLQFSLIAANAATPPPTSEDACLAWMPAAAFAETLGQKVLEAHFEESECSIKLEEYTVHIKAKNGSVLGKTEAKAASPRANSVDSSDNRQPDSSVQQCAQSCP